MPGDHLEYLRSLRAAGYSDAEKGEPDKSGSLKSVRERLEYYKGWEDWHVQNVPKYQRWTPVEDLEKPAGRRFLKDGEF